MPSPTPTSSEIRSDTELDAADSASGGEEQPGPLFPPRQRSTMERTALASLRAAGRAGGRAGGWLRRVAALLRRHWIATILIAIGAMVRVAVTVAYWPAFWFDDSARYLFASRSWSPDTHRPYGYSLLLKVLTPTGSIATVTILQHLAGLGLAIALYAFMAKRELPRWLAAIGVAPLVLDAHQIGMEQLVLAETLFTVLVAAALITVLWRERPGWIAAASAGGLLAAASLTRSVSLPLIVLLLGYLLVRRLGWRTLAACTLAFLIPLGGYVVWYHQAHDSWALTGTQGRFVYGRAATFVRCERLDLTVEEQLLCPTEPHGQRHDAGYYTWQDTAPGHRFPNIADDPLFSGFARKTIKAQTGEYAAVIARETLGFFRPKSGREPDCPDCGYLPRGDGSEKHGPALLDDFGGQKRVWGEPTGLTKAVYWYGRVMQMPRVLLGLGVLLPLLAAAWPRRLRRGRWDGLLLAAAGVGLLAGASATAQLYFRYGVPMLALLPIAAVVAIKVLATRATPRDTPVS